MFLELGLIVDVETTGINPEHDRIIELGVLEFAVIAGETPKITRMMSYLADPEAPLSQEIIDLTGLTDALLKGQSLPLTYLRALFGKASILVAHNAAFDRAFVERAGLVDGDGPPWACTLRHINWRKHGYQGSHALTYLAADHGFINPFPHRALFDCATTFKLMAPHFAELLQRSLEREYLVSAEHSPFETKDALKARGYRWDGERRVWCKLVAESELQDERQFLATEIYRGRSRHSEVEQRW